jgi:hypothetical protein
MLAEKGESSTRTDDTRKRNDKAEIGHYDCDE